MAPLQNEYFKSFLTFEWAKVKVILLPVSWFETLYREWLTQCRYRNQSTMIEPEHEVVKKNEEELKAVKESAESTVKCEIKS